MTYTHNKESGFTLVELAIVMIIIGLLIGGILKGQELIANAQTTATIAQIKGLDGAISTFDDKYNAMPGDMTNVATRLSNCGAECVIDGDGNGRIDGTDMDADPTLDGDTTDEPLTAFLHLGAADLITGVDNAIDGATEDAGSAVPEAEFGGAIWVGYHAGGDITTGIDEARRGHYLIVKDDIAGVADDSTVGVTAVNAGRVDRKLDDGNANTGDVRATGGTCEDADGVYEEGDNEAFCDLVVRVQG